MIVNAPSINELMAHLPPAVAERLGYYVYLYIDPRSDQTFYVGKGQHERVLAGFTEAETRRAQIVKELRENGLVPRLEILAHGLKDEETAFRIEAAAIDLLGLESLTNAVRGFRSLQYGRMTLDELIGYYAAPAVTIDDPVLLIRVNQLYRHKMSEHELYEITRGIWKLGERRRGARYALAVFEGVVREAYAIAEWRPAMITGYSTRDLSERDLGGRWEFVGGPASEEVRTKYRLHSVRAYFRRGNQSPVIYVNC